MRPLRRPIACLLLVWYLPACTSYKTTAVAPQEAVAGQKTVIVTVDAGGSQETLHVNGPWVRGDTLGGTPCRLDDNRVYRCSTDEAWAVPLSQVVEVKTKQVDGFRTTVAVVGGLAVGMLVAATIAVCADDFLGQNC